MGTTFKRLLLAGAAALALSACQTANGGLQSHEVEKQVDEAALAEFLTDKPASLASYYEVMLAQGNRNLVLNNMRIGLAAMEMGETAAAVQAFDKALDQIEIIYADNEAAAEARSLWTKENVKDFKGEPYERAMAYFYRGLLYMNAGDYQNARAVFKAAQLQDAFAEEDQNQADFALMYFMEGWASQCAGDTAYARDPFERALALNGNLSLPAEDHRLLVVRETGSAPRKVAAGESNELLSYEPGTAESFQLSYTEVGTHAAVAAPAEDIFFQAASRGGRLVDHVLAGKASFKEGADAAGDVLANVGATTAMMGALGGSNDAAIAGLAILLASAIAEGAAAAARSEADIRQWDNLPNRVTVTSLPLDAASGNGVSRLIGVDGSERSFEYQQAGSCALGWARSTPASDIPLRAPGSGGEAAS